TPDRLSENSDPDHPIRLESLFKKLDVLLEHIPVAKEFFDLVPKKYKENIDDEYHPQGPATIHYVFTRDDPVTGTRYCKITPEGAQALVTDFPYRFIERVTGSIEFASSKDKEDLLTLNLMGYAANQPIKVVGEIRGEIPNHEVKIEISGQNIPLDERLKEALPQDYVPIAESFHPSGRGEFVATISRSPKTKQFANRYWVKFHDCKVCYDIFPYPLERVSGILDILPDKHFEFRDFRGFHKGGEFRITGRSFRSPNKAEGEQDRLEMTMVGKSFVLDRELREAVARSVDDPGMPRAWDAFDPKGRINFNGTVMVPAGKKGETKPDIDLTVLPQGCRIKPTFFAYEMTDLYGTLHYKQGRIEVTDARARHGKSILTLDKGDIRLKPKGGVYAVLNKIEANPLIPDAAIVNALPTMLKKGCEVLQITDPLTFSTKLIFDTTGEPGEKPDLYWDGKISAKDITVHTGITLEHLTGEVACHGRYNPAELEAIDRATEKPNGIFLKGNLNLESATLFSKEKFQNVRAAFAVTKADRDIVRIDEIMADFCGGKVYGPLHIEFGPVVRYSTNLMASNIDVREFARLNFDEPNDVSGKATVHLAFEGKGSDPDNLKGKGIVEVPNAKLYNLPPFVGILKFLGLRLPDRTAFDEAYAAFDIERGRIQFTELKVLGDAFSLQGKGAMKLNGSDLDMEFNVGWARIAQALPGFSAIQTMVSRQLLKLRVRGEVGKVTYTTEPLPAILDPFKKLITSSDKGKKKNGE
ncbi:MAG TPA: AsmA-like C-terminal region-containing protein, partial [Gemmataceae bacterium]|nr:AsmA-like C-terminal region-containing protein [Gemmataceae bacterium]